MAAKKRDRGNYIEGSINVKARTTNNGYKLFNGQLKQQQLHLYPSEPTHVQAKAEQIISLLEVQSVAKDDGRKAAFPTIVVKYRNKTSTNDVRIRAPQQQLQEKWFNYIYTVSMLKIPANISSLLPGQVQELKDIAESLQQPTYLEIKEPQLNKSEERRRMSYDCANNFTPANHQPQPFKLPQPGQMNGLNSTPKTQLRPVGPIFSKHTPTVKSPPLSPKPVKYLPGNSLNNQLSGSKSTSPQLSRSSSASRDCPSWLFEDEIGRQEVEKLLTNKSSLGNLVIRRRTSKPSDLWQYAVSIKMTGSSPPSQFKHYKVQKKTEYGKTTYLISLADSQPAFSSFEDIVNYFVGIDSNKYKPMGILDDSNDTYDDTVQPGLYTVVEGSDAYQNETFDQDYNNVTCDVRDASRKSSTLPQIGRTGNYPPPTMPRRPSAPVSSTARK